MAPSPRQFLNVQGMGRFSGFKFESKFHGIRFGTLSVRSCGRKTEILEELRKKRVDVCCMQEVRWKGRGARLLGTSGQRYKLWWSGNNVGSEGVGTLVKEKIFCNAMEVSRKKNCVMATMLTLEKEVMRIIYACDILSYYNIFCASPGIE